MPVGEKGSKSVFDHIQLHNRWFYYIMPGTCRKIEVELHTGIIHL